MEFAFKSHYRIDDLLQIMRILRGEGGCPWDREQTHQSIRRNLLEETYEVAEAIDMGDSDLLLEELGDVLLQVVFHAGIESDAGRFDLDGVADGICKKRIYRHPHVFDTVQVSSTGEVLRNWDALKKAEKGQATTADTMAAVARSLPGLWRAEKVQKKAAKTGFDWPDVSGALDKLSEELEELKDAVRQGTNVSEELGDLLFSAVNVARFVEADPEQALSDATDKFIARYRAMEETLLAEGQSPETLDLSAWNRRWEAAKEQGGL